MKFVESASYILRFINELMWRLKRINYKTDNKREWKTTFIKLLITWQMLRGVGWSIKGKEDFSNIKISSYLLCSNNEIEQNCEVVEVWNLVKLKIKRVSFY